MRSRKIAMHDRCPGTDQPSTFAEAMVDKALAVRDGSQASGSACVPPASSFLYLASFVLYYTVPAGNREGMNISDSNLDSKNESSCRLL
jgi:hypothetical protein